MPNSKKKKVTGTENWPRFSNVTVLCFHFSQIHFSSGAHLSFSHPLFREMSSFLPLPAPSLIPPSECHHTIRPIIPKTLMETMTRTRTKKLQRQWQTHWQRQRQRQWQRQWWRQRQRQRQWHAISLINITVRVSPSIQLLPTHPVLQLTYKDSREMFYAPTTQFWLQFPPTRNNMRKWYSCAFLSMSQPSFDFSSTKLERKDGSGCIFLLLRGRELW